MSSLSGSLYLYLPIHHTHKHLPVLPTSCAALLLLLLLSSRCCCLLTSKIGLRPFRLFEIIKKKTNKKKQNDQSRSCRLKFCLVIFVSAFFLVWFHISDGFTNYFVWFLFFIYLSILTIINFVFYHIQISKPNQKNNWNKNDSQMVTPDALFTLFGMSTSFIFLYFHWNSFYFNYFTLFVVSSCSYVSVKWNSTPKTFSYFSQSPVT